MLICSIVAYVALLIYIVYNIITCYHIKKERCILFSGSMGSGKTLTAVRMCKRLVIYQYLVQLWNIVRHPFKTRFHRIYVYSNIPLSWRNYRHLETEHIKREKPLPEGTIVLIDEIGGTLANQYSYESQVTTEILSNFVRFMRHWFDGFLICTDQTSDSVPKAVRDRIGTEYYLSKCRWWFFLWKKIDIVPVLHIGCDTQNNIEHETTTQAIKVPFTIVGIPFKAYNSRCYKETYTQGFVFSKEDDIPYNKKKLTTRLYNDIEPTLEESNLMKKDKRQAKRNLLGRKMEF